jgi:RNA polymerase sigma factor (sigma-70 family)
MAVSSDLIKNCKQRLPQAQWQLYDLYKARLMGVCRRYTRCKEDAQDVLQESFIKIFASIESLEEVAKFESWILRITVHTAINYYHKHKVRYNATITINDFDSAGTDYEDIVSGLTDAQLVSLISELPDGCRMAFNMFVMEGYSHHEIAELLHVNEGTSRSQVNYAKGILKSKLKTLGILRYEKYA